MVIRLYKQGPHSFRVVVKHARRFKLSSASRFCKDKAEVRVFMEQEVEREAVRGVNIAGTLAREGQL